MGRHRLEPRVDRDAVGKVGEINVEGAEAHAGGTSTGGFQPSSSGCAHSRNRRSALVADFADGLVDPAPSPRSSS